MLLQSSVLLLLRDSSEAGGFCPVGNDLNEDITPVEAGLTWTIAKTRRVKFDFLGGEVRAALPPSLFSSQPLTGVP